MRELLSSVVTAFLFIVAPTEAGAREAEELPSCEAKIAAYIEDANAPQRKADLAADDYAAVLSRGTYLNSCGVPSDMAVKICAAVQDGKAVGVTVSTDPSNAEITTCVRGQVASLEFPAHPRMDVTRTTFAATVEEQKPFASDTQPEAPPPVEPKRSGCACSVPEAASNSWIAGLAALGFLVSRRGTRQTTRTS